MKKVLLLPLFLIIILSQFVFPQGTYYDGIDPNSSSFITALHSLINPHTKISYDQFDETNVANFASRDTTGGKKVVTCVYSGQNYVYTPPFAWGEFSREHTWCHSWMPTYPSQSGPEYSDQHHLFPTNQNKANGVRNNYPLGNVVNITSQYLEGKLGTDANGTTVYEPRNRHKGDAARALFYMAVCYDGSGGRWYLPSFQDQTILKQWSEADMPDAWEKARNEYVYSIQNNRNPFVDHPEWVSLIDFSNLAYLGGGTVIAVEPTNYLTGLSVESVTSNSITLNWTDALPGTQSPSGYLLLANKTNIFTDPVDGVVYNNDLNLADGSSVIAIDFNDSNSYIFYNLTASTTYYFKIYSLNGTGSQINYKTDGTVPLINGITLTASGTSSTLLSQDWTNTGMITANDNWSGVNGIVGYLGDYSSSSPTNVDPQTLLSDMTNVDVIANQASTAITNGGVGEFEITNPVVALQGSGTADAPNLIFTFSTLGFSDINVSYNVRDIDESSDNAVQQVALQYRIGNSGSFTNIPAGYVADATTGPSLATIVTAVNVTLPADADNKSVVQVRVITTNAAGSDEWVGIDDILITGSTASVLAAEPTNYPTSFAVSSKTNNDVTLSWIDAIAGSQSPSGYLLLANTTNSFIDPADGISYSDDTDLTNGSAVVNIPFDSANEYTFNSLTDYTDYYFRLYSYSGTGEQTNYKTDGTVPFLQVKTDVPVELISFNAEIINRGVKLIWTTATETNNRGFSIERKKNLSNGTNFSGANNSVWEEVGFVNGSGSSSTTNNYSFVDKSLPYFGKYVYRLKQVDYNGTTNYSDNVEINFKYLGGFKLEQNYPNPFNPSTVISWAIPTGNFTTLKIYDAIGNEVAVLVNEFIPAGDYNTPFRVSENLSSGIYFYKLTSGSVSSTKKMILLR